MATPSSVRPWFRFNRYYGSGFFNDANEWLTRDTDGDGTADVTMTYDEVGNMTDDGEDYLYVYDPFGRLREVKARGTSALVAEYRYNGLNQRITTHFDTDADNDVDASDVISHFAYDARWRMAARYEDTDTDPTEQWVFHHAGLAEAGNSSYIDSVILRDRDTTANGTLDERVYYLQNWRADVVALIKDNGDQIEQVRYEPYGTAFGLPAGDIDSDGDFGSDDYAGIATTPYDVRKDVNMDGTVSFADTSAAYNLNGLHTMARGTPTSTKINNRKTYAAYEHLPELAGTKYDVRNRVLLAELGTWSRRDPMGYVDGLNLYAYVMLMPIVMVDEQAFLASVGAGVSGAGGAIGAGGSSCGIGGSSIASVSGCGGQTGGGGGVKWRYPAIPCGTSQRHTVCRRWATQVCNSRGGSARSPFCTRECVRAATQCCSKRGCNRPGRENKCTAAGFLAMGRCNGQPSNLDRTACWSACYDEVKVSCKKSCSQCSSAVFDPLGQIEACAFGCLIKLYNTPIPKTPAARKKFLTACLKGCGLGWLFWTEYSCIKCLTCMSYGSLICQEQCYWNW